MDGKRDDTIMGTLQIQAAHHTPSHSTQCGVGKARSRGETNAVPRAEVAWYRLRWQDEGFLAQFRKVQYMEWLLSFISCHTQLRGHDIAAASLPELRVVLR